MSQSSYIDTFGAPPCPALLRSWIESTYQYEGYMSIFGQQAAAAMGITRDAFLRRWRVDDRKALLGDIETAMGAMQMSPQDWSKSMLDGGFGAVGVWIPQEGVNSDTLVALAAYNEHDVELFALVETGPDGTEANAMITEVAEHLPVRAILTQPFKHHVAANAPAWDDVYHLCEKKRLVAWIHCSASWDTASPITYGDPIAIDKIACIRPDLKIIIGHGGWPWVQQAALVSWRHKNVYLEPSAHRWEYFSKPGSGWEPLLHFGRNTIRRKVLFGSAWPLTGQPPAIAANHIKEMLGNDDIAKDWLGENAREVYGV